VPERGEIPVKEVLEADHGRFAQTVAVAIVVTTLLAALCGYMQAKSLLRNDDALTRAQQWGTLASTVTDDNRQAEQVLLTRYRRQQADHQRAAYVVGQRVWRIPGATTGNAAAWALLASHVERDSAQLATAMGTELTGIRSLNEASIQQVNALHAGDGAGCRAGAWAAEQTPGAIATNRLGESPEQDPNFPARYIADAARTGYQLDGLRTAADSESAAVGKQFTRYAVSLATLAIAVFLLGYSLTPHGRHHRKLYALAAGVLVTGASLWGVYAAVREPQTAPPEAMAAYADGRVAYDRREYATAIRYFSCSVAQDPEFAPAYQWRAISYLGSTQTSFEVPSSDLSRGIGDAEHAISLGSNDPELLNDLSAMLYVTGIRRHDLGPIGQAGTFMASAHREDPTDPTIAFNLAEDELALGQFSVSGYQRAEKLAGDAAAFYELASLGSLVNVEASSFGTTLHGPITAARRSLITELSRGSSPAGTEAAPSTVLANGGPPSLSMSLSRADGTSDLAPGQFGITIPSGHGFDPRRDRLYAVWYYRSGAGWTEEGPSGPIAAGTAESLHIDSNGQLTTSLPTRQCLPNGEYKAELYVNGLLAGQAIQTLHSDSLSSRTLGDLNFRYCTPSGWRTRSPSSSLAGLIEGNVSPTGNAGMLVVDASADGARIHSSRAVLRDVVQRLGGLLPSGLAHPQNQRLPFGDGMCDADVEAYSYRGGRLLAGIGRDAYGREIAGIVYGPLSTFASPPSPFSARDLFTSMVSESPRCPAGS
jgi:tetratricopeptide (TPR) repeat protein